MKTILSAANVLALVFFASLVSADEVPFNQGQFDSAKAAGQPVAVVFHADWCPTCRAQAPLLKDLAQQPEFAPVYNLDCGAHCLSAPLSFWSVLLGHAVLACLPCFSASLWRA